jgi:hypothetical protein
LTAIRYPHPWGTSKQYINLIIWSRPRVNNCLCLISHFLSSWLSSSFHWFLFCSNLEVSTESSKLSSSIVTVLPVSQFTLVFYQPLSSTTAVLLNFSVVRAVVVFYQLKFNMIIKIYLNSTVSILFY